MDKEYRLIIEPVAKPLEAQLFFGQDLQDLQDFMNAVFFVGFKILLILLILSKRGFASASINNGHVKVVDFVWAACRRSHGCRT